MKTLQSDMRRLLELMENREVDHVIKEVEHDARLEKLESALETLRNSQPYGGASSSGENNPFPNLMVRMSCIGYLRQNNFLTAIILLMSKG